MANWSSLSVKDAIRKIRDGEMVLPVIQRRLVWPEEKMEALFDSLLKGNSFGSVICIEEDKDTKPLFAFREFTRDGHNVVSMEVEELTKTQWFIIDGQQRLQSFYIGLDGKYHDKVMYFDLYSDYSEGEYDFKFTSNIKDLPSDNKERSETAIQECLWYPATDLFQRLSQTTKARQVAKEIIKKFSIEDGDKIECIETTVQDFFDGIFADESIGMSKVSINKSKEPVENRQRIVELFRRLNDGGTKLSSYDLVASMFKGFDYKMEQFLDTVVAENEDIGIDQDVLIKLLLILNDKPSKEMSDLTAEDAEFATSNFERIQMTLKALKVFLKATDNYNWFASTKNRSTIPLYFLAYNIFYKKAETIELSRLFERFDTNDVDCHNMAVWLRLSLLNKVFSRGCGWIPYRTGIKKIHKVMQSKRGMDFPTNEIFAVYRSHPLYFYRSVSNETINNFEQEYLFYLLYNGQNSVRNEDIDHVHPKSLLTQAGFNDYEINRIGNYQLLDSGTNRGVKNGKELGDWIRNNIDAANIQGYLIRHMIPNEPDLWETKSFKEFMNERTALLVKKLNSYL